MLKHDLREAWIDFYITIDTSVLFSFSSISFSIFLGEGGHTWVVSVGWVWVRESSTAIQTQSTPLPLWSMTLVFTKIGNAFPEAPHNVLSLFIFPQPLSPPLYLSLSIMVMSTQSGSVSVCLSVFACLSLWVWKPLHKQLTATTTWWLWWGYTQKKKKIIIYILSFLLALSGLDSCQEEWTHWHCISLHVMCW